MSVEGPPNLQSVDTAPSVAALTPRSGGGAATMPGRGAALFSADVSLEPRPSQQRRQDRILAPEFWDAPLSRFAKATGVSISLLGTTLQRYSGLHASSPLASKLAEAGFWAAGSSGCELEARFAAAAMAQQKLSYHSVFGALGVCAMPAFVGGELVGAFVAGWVPDQFVDPLASHRIAEEVGLPEMEVWQVMRMQPPMTNDKMLLYMDMLQNFAEVLLQQLESKERDREQAWALRILNSSAIDLSVATTDQEICSTLALAVGKLLPNADVAISTKTPDGCMKSMVGHSPSFTRHTEMFAEYSLKIPIKSASQGLLGVIDVLLPQEDPGRDKFSAELSTLAAQAAVALQKAKLIFDLEAERRALDQANVELRNLHRMKDEFLATISHEFRTPLNSMLGWSQILKEDHLSADEFQEATSAIERNAKVQARLIEDLLDVSRIISGKMTLERDVINLTEILRRSIETVAPICESRSQKVHIQHAESLIPVRADATRLQQVFWNILANAAKFTPEAGTITVTAERRGGYAMVSICDNGQGIAKDFLPHIFDRFSQADGSTTRAHGGLGLGLAIVRHIVELHGGCAAVASPGEGLGATFTVTLPINLSDGELASAREAVRDLDLGALGSHGKLSGFKILAVDDQPDALRLVTFILEKNGALVQATDSTAKALHEVKTWRPDLILSDLSMPGENGFEFLQQVRELPVREGGATPAFALSALAGPADKRKALACGFQRYFSKPLDPRALLVSIQELRAGAVKDGSAVDLH